MNTEVIHDSMKKLRLHIVSININLHQKFIYKCMCQIDWTFEVVLHFMKKNCEKRHYVIYNDP